MDLKTLLIALDLLEIGLAAGASTFALTFYFMGIKDEVIDASERRFMGAVYFVLRVAIVVIVVTELFYILYWGFDAFTLVKTMEVLWFRWMLLGIIVANALLMHFHKMPMWLGPALAGGSWYALFSATIWPDLALPFETLLSYYAIFVVAMIAFLRLVKFLYLKK
ncbi:MAG TPA: hypothetical protein VGA06_00475 [Candidatus Paceibacterota bacterium]|jgi:hypothetical protein